MSKPDITNAVRAVSRHSNNPAETHWKAVLQIIRYLLGTKDLSLTFEWGSGLDISVFADANYAVKADDRRSLFGVAVNRAIRPCHPSHSVPLALILPRGDQ